MARVQYGQTWWGGEWLNALSRLDYDNRLPRGRAYANKGAVKNLRIRGGLIEAGVQGSRPRPYQVRVDVPAWRDADKMRLLDAIADDPSLIARLMNRELDPQLLELARQLKIAVFPAQWKDLPMQCNCPDWAVPCKHLAATIYLLSREIDGNPFLVFALRGLDLVAELKKRNIEITPQHQVIPRLSEAVLAVEESGAEHGVVDFTRIPDLLDSLVSVLPGNPSFYHGKDFVGLYHKTLKKLGKEAERLLLVPAEERPAFLSGDQPLLVLAADGQARVAGVAGCDVLSDLLARLAVTAPQTLPDLQPAVGVFHSLRLAALHLLARGAVVPQLFDPGNGATGLRWLPAWLDPAVRDVLCALTSGAPPLLRLGSEEAPPLAQVLAVCSLMLNEVVTQVRAAGADDRVAALFFADLRARFTGVGEGQISAGIQQWLSRFHLAQREHAPVLCLEEQGDSGFAVTIGVANKTDPQAAPLPLNRILHDPSWQASRFGVLQSVALLADFFPPLHGYLRRQALEPIVLSADELPGLLFESLPLIRLLGVRALLPRALEKILRPRMSMRVTAQPGDSGGFLNMADLFDFDWSIAIGDRHLSLAEFEQMVQTASGVIRFRGEYVFLDPAEIARLQAQLARPPGVSGAELVRVALAGEYAGAAVDLDDAAQALLRQLGAAGEAGIPSGLDACLRPYQTRGYQWLYRNATVGLGSVIADDMGLGKTLQVIAALLKLKQDGALAQARALVVVPTSLLTNWQKEIARFAPALSVEVFHGSKRSLSGTRPDVLLTTYGVIRGATAPIKALAWRVLVLDEAQNIKNPLAAQTRAVKSIAAGAYVAISGTPVENRLSEYWSIMDFANRGFLGTLGHFIKEYATPIQTHRDQQVAQRFKKITAPFLLRRLKSDKSIISDLPDKIEQDQFCELTAAQVSLYESVVREGLSVIHGEADTFKRQGLVLQMILALKQICNHPAQYLKQGDDGFDLSGKAVRFLELLDEIHANHEKVLVFTQFRAMGEILARWLEQRFGRATPFLHGGVSRAQRDAMVDAFQNDRTERVLILSLKAGGTGLNLTAASNVIHFDLWWNPAVEAQATDRAYRIGQHRNVQVHRLITRATFEEKINDMIRAKKSLADLAVGTGEQWIGHLSGDELKDIFALASG